MRIERIDAAYDGDNVSKKIKLFVDEQFRALAVYLYFVPVVGDEVYTTADPITLDENGEAEYLLPGDVLNGEGCYAAQIVCIDTNGTEIAKSAIFVDECGASIDDNSAVLPTGEVITLAQLYERFEALTASDIGYEDNEQVGASNVQEAIDYALTHGGGGGSMPTYTLRWADNEAEYRDYNVYEISKFINRPIGSYELFLQLGTSGSRISAYEINNVGGLTAYFRGAWNGEQENLYKITSNATVASYSQRKYILPESTFDRDSLASGSMLGTAEYIDERIGTTGNLDPDSYASADDLEAIEEKVPVWDAKYTKPANGIPKSDLVEGVQEAIDLADTALQSIRAGVGIAVNGNEVSLSSAAQTTLADVPNKQNILTPGTGISIVNDVISATTVLPVYVLEWYASPTEEQKAANAAILAEIRSAEEGEYIAYVKVSGRYLNVVNVNMLASGIEVYAENLNGEVKTIYKLFSITGTYGQSVSTYPETTFDPDSDAAGSMYATAEYIDDLLADKQDKPDETSSSANTVTISELADNTEYRYTDLEALTISAYPQGNFEAWLRLTFASSGTITVTLPTSSYIGSAPTFGNGETWELSIKDGVVVAGKVS